jgi:hypothetical protein
MVDADLTVLKKQLLKYFHVLFCSFALSQSTQLAVNINNRVERRFAESGI